MLLCDTWTAEGEPFVISLQAAAASHVLLVLRCLALPPACACDLCLSSFESSAGDIHWKPTLPTQSRCCQHAGCPRGVSLILFDGCVARAGVFVCHVSMLTVHRCHGLYVYHHRIQLRRLQP
jgi:hypothetical protein